MTAAEITEYIAGLPGVVVWTAAPGDGSPEIAWGDSFFYYSPGCAVPATTQPFATIVTKDYPGDETSRLGRPDAFRLNIAVGTDALSREVRQETGDDADPSAVDVLRPHPVYGRAGWAAVINPGPRTGESARRLVADAHRKARERYERQQARPTRR